MTQSPHTLTSPLSVCLARLCHSKKLDLHHPSPAKSKERVEGDVGDRERKRRSERGKKEEEKRKRVLNQVTEK